MKKRAFHVIILCTILLLLSATFVFAQTTQESPEPLPEGCDSDCSKLTSKSDLTCTTWCLKNKDAASKAPSSVLKDLDFTASSAPKVNEIKYTSLTADQQGALGNNPTFTKAYGDAFGNNLLFGKKSGFEVSDIKFDNSGKVTYKGRTYDLASVPSGSTASITQSGIDFAAPAKSNIDVSNLGSGDRLFMSEGTLTGKGSVSGVGNNPILFGDKGEVILPEGAFYIDEKTKISASALKGGLTIIHGDQLPGIFQNTIAFRNDGKIDLYSSPFGFYGVNGLNPKELNLNHDLVNGYGGSWHLEKLSISGSNLEHRYTGSIFYPKDLLIRSDVKNIQTALNLLGYRDYNGNLLAVDGYFGPKTESAYKSFQLSNGQDSNGIFNSKGRSLLEAELRNKIGDSYIIRNSNGDEQRVLFSEKGDPLIDTPKGDKLLSINRGSSLLSTSPKSSSSVVPGGISTAGDDSGSNVKISNLNPKLEEHLQIANAIKIDPKKALEFSGAKATVARVTKYSELDPVDVAAYIKKGYSKEQAIAELGKTAFNGVSGNNLAKPGLTVAGPERYKGYKVYIEGLGLFDIHDRGSGVEIARAFTIDPKNIDPNKYGLTESVTEKTVIDVYVGEGAFKSEFNRWQKKYGDYARVVLIPPS